MKTINDSNTGKPLFIYELPDDFAAEAACTVADYAQNRKVQLLFKATDKDREIVYQSGSAYIYEKKKANPVLTYMPVNQIGSVSPSGAVYALCPNSLKEDLDAMVSTIAGKKLAGKAYYDLSDTIKERQNQEFSEELDNFISSTNLLMSFQSIAMSVIIRNYLLDGGIGIYEDGEKIIAVALTRMGYETDILTGNGIVERLSDAPFGKAPDDFGAYASTVEWSLPFVSYMTSNKKEDLKTFMAFLDSIRLTDSMQEEIRAFRKQVDQFYLEQARMETMRNQMMWDNAFADQQRQFAAMDRLSASISADLERFHENQANLARTNDARFDLGGSSGETSDERIQRMRHESMMGVETYNRSDGSEVEYSSMADRVFENNLDNTAHFGTHHYYDDYVPEGWHELKKK